MAVGWETIVTTSWDATTRISTLTVTVGDAPAVTFTSQDGGVETVARATPLIFVAAQFQDIVNAVEAWAADVRAHAAPMPDSQFSYTSTLSRSPTACSIAATLWGGIVVGAAWVKSTGKITLAPRAGFHVPMHVFDQFLAIHRQLMESLP